MMQEGRTTDPLLESELRSLLPATRGPRRQYSPPFQCLILLVAAGTIVLAAWVLLNNPSHDHIIKDVKWDGIDESRTCDRSLGPCFSRAKIRVEEDQPGFPSFWSYAHQGPIWVSYDERALTLNGERSFFLGGSFHPSRATQITWNYALDEAVRGGLNLITIYVMWSAHQVLPNSELDWGFPGTYNVACDDKNSASDATCGWNLASAIRAAADRGLFVHLRVGPYDCAEYNYGGIPEWLALHKPKLEMRRPNREWLDVMKEYVSSLIRYIDEEQLWAHQGGNIIMAQIENELGADGDFESPENRLLVDKDGNFVDPGSAAPDGRTLRNATIQDYADWCGALAQELAPNVTWTMCNGLYANNTILTCNAIDTGHHWLEEHGGENGRIQIDQPAIFTEFEGGFQTWGSTAENPLDYFWGRTARAMARDALKWFARGGCHLNYYMFYGSYNRGRQAAAGITNMYASESPLCPSGQRRQPKFGHFEALHEAITGVVPILLAAKTALGNDIVLRYQDHDGIWKQGKDQRAFVYKTNDSEKSVIFLENDADKDVVIQLPDDKSSTNVAVLTMNAHSAMLVVDGNVEFDSSSVDPRSMSVERIYLEKESVPLLLDWVSFKEPVGARSGHPATWTSSSPIEQTRLNADSGISSDYAWYETSFYVESDVKGVKLYIETQMADAFVAFIDDRYVGAADHHFKKEGPITLKIELGDLAGGKHRLQLLSESLGYMNLIGRWGGTTLQKTKGITGNVWLSLGGTNTSLVDGRDWRSYPGLHGEAVARVDGMNRGSFMKKLDGVSSRRTATWSSVLFDSPGYDPTFQAFAVTITRGRGHLWLNGRDLGRYWNITRGETDMYSQDTYFLPSDYLHADGRLNELIIFDAFGEPRGHIDLEVSWLSNSESNIFPDEVDYKDACL
jgi:Glycosyl hydrolases family 35